MNNINYFKKTKIANTDYDQKFGNDEFNTVDTFTIPSREFVLNASEGDRIVSGTDYCNLITINDSLLVDNSTVQYLLRSHAGPVSVDVVDKVGRMSAYYATSAGNGVRVMTTIDVNKFLESRNENLGFKVKKDINNKKVYLTIPELMSPQKKVDSKTSKMLTEKLKKGELVHTPIIVKGATIPEYNIDDYASEYVYDGKLYVYAQSYALMTSPRFENWNPLVKGSCDWYEVTPIEWEILNPENLSKSIYKEGNGTSNEIHVIADKAFLQLPFAKTGDEYARRAYKDSYIRDYLENSFLYEIDHTQVLEKLAEANQNEDMAK